MGFADPHPVEQLKHYVGASSCRVGREEWILEAGTSFLGIQ